MSEKNCKFLFLSEFRQISVNFNKFCYVDVAEVAEIVCYDYTFSTSPDPRHYTLLNADNFFTKHWIYYSHIAQIWCQNEESIQYCRDDFLA